MAGSKKVSEGLNKAEIGVYGANHDSATSLRIIAYCPTTRLTISWPLGSVTTPQPKKPGCFYKKYLY
jgi:hypothetical protein